MGDDQPRFIADRRDFVGDPRRPALVAFVGRREPARHQPARRIDLDHLAGDIDLAAGPDPDMLPARSRFPVGAVLMAPV